MKKLLKLVVVLTAFVFVTTALFTLSKSESTIQNFMVEKNEMNGSEPFKAILKNGVVAFGEETFQKESGQELQLQKEEGELNGQELEVKEIEESKGEENMTETEKEEMTELAQNFTILEDYLDKYIMPNIMAIVTSVGMVFAVFNRFRKILNLYKTDKDKFSKEKEKEFAFLKSEMENALSQIVETKEKTLESVENLPIAKMSQAIQKEETDIRKIKDALISFSTLFESLLKSQKLSAEGSILPSQLKEKLAKVHSFGEEAIETLKIINLMGEIENDYSNQPNSNQPSLNEPSLNQPSSNQPNSNQPSSNEPSSNGSTESTPSTATAIATVSSVQAVSNTPISNTSTSRQHLSSRKLTKSLQKKEGEER